MRRFCIELTEYTGTHLQYFAKKRLNAPYVIARGITVQPSFKHKHEGSPGEGPLTDVGQGTESDWVTDDSKGENDLG